MNAVLRKISTQNSYLENVQRPLLACSLLRLAECSQELPSMKVFFLYIALLQQAEELVHLLNVLLKVEL